MLKENFAGIVPLEEFLAKYLPPPTAELPTTVVDIVSRSAKALQAAKKAASEVENEDDDATKIILYLREIVAKFPKETKPCIADTRWVVFKSLDADHHYTKPDVTVGRPGRTASPHVRPEAGTILELKHKVDIFDQNQDINDSVDSRNALTQLAKSARSLLMASNACYVFVVSVFRHGMARIFRFDHSGFRATTAFDWKTETKIFPAFFFRLYNPNGTVGRMAGDDDTISIPTAAVKREMYEAMRKHDFYNDAFETQEDVTKHSLWISAVRFKNVNGTRISEIVRCFTLGSILSYSDGLFSRATHVYRVILEDDVDLEEPPIYALKDVWRQACRRPEADFYDTIAKYRSEKRQKVPEMDGMARCHGSIDLSVSTGAPAPTWDWTRHRTCSAKKGPSFDRCHTRSLLTPVGKPIKSFPSTKAMVQALYHAVLHHEIAFEAGVLHRDVSEGNVLFEEGPAEQDPKSFLVDWDYSEFTLEGLKNFNTWFPERKNEQDQYTDVDKSLKDMTGTLPFMAIQILDPRKRGDHGPHHDLESIYWLLVWMILRHTKHNHSDGAFACSKLFDLANFTTKRGWSNDPTPIEDIQSPLFRLAERLRDMVYLQNQPEQRSEFSSAPARVLITYKKFLTAFREELASALWPENDAALPFELPSANPAKTESKAVSLITETLQKVTRASVQGSGSWASSRSLASAQGSGSLKRARDGNVDDDPSTAAPASGSKDGPSDARKAKKQK
ncbi:hypothetical protein C8F04DRAFT_996420 [Mycena alexandri]|uniref:Fungal-type protein kinase domain-containing protein n=1 Tax=Mycena alexandri TaxID=1745969 RepID=A0AAD6T6R6_9AGAR|nr:hypothetical protein C8F04DRAFT_996420 [Mycena alexandri]